MSVYLSPGLIDIINFIQVLFMLATIALAITLGMKMRAFQDINDPVSPHIPSPLMEVSEQLKIIAFAQPIFDDFSHLHSNYLTLLCFRKTHQNTMEIGIYLIARFSHRGLNPAVPCMLDTSAPRLLQTMATVRKLDVTFCSKVEMPWTLLLLRFFALVS
jgi:hypothetical protein